MLGVVSKRFLVNLDVVPQDGRNFPSFCYSFVSAFYSLSSTRGNTQGIFVGSTETDNVRGLARAGSKDRRKRSNAL